MSFWKMAFDLNCITAEQLRGAVLTKENKYGEISIEEFKIITGEDFTS